MKKAFDKESDRKKIHEKEIRQKTNKILSIRNDLFIDLDREPLNRFSTIKYKPLSPPQIIKVQFAPCQKPLIRNVINKFIKDRIFDLARLPPSAI